MVGNLDFVMFLNEVGFEVVGDNLFFEMVVFGVLIIGMFGFMGFGWLL